MRKRAVLFALALAAAVIAAQRDSSGQVVRCATDSTSQQSGSCNILFRAGRPNPILLPVPNRDVEFMWDPFNDSTITADVQATLDNFGRTLSFTQANPLGAPYSDFQLIYEYFRNPAYGLSYAYEPRDTSSVWVGDRDATVGYKPSDRSHVDVYLYNSASPASSACPSGDMPLGHGSYPAEPVSGEEDLSTAHAFGDIRHANSIMYPVPQGTARLDPAGTGWTRPGSMQNLGFNHEVRHSLPKTVLGYALGELFSAGAEAVGGPAVDTSTSFPFTWSLFASTVNPGGHSCTQLRGQSSNYVGRSAFAAYLVYNFQGTDTAPTVQGFADDLMHRWATDSAASFVDLPERLDDSVCPDCADKGYFRAAPGVSLPNPVRLGLLIHNWRVANFVNNDSLAEGQYGYPRQYGFSPANNLGTWRPHSGCPGSTDELIVTPPEVTLGVRQATRDTMLRDMRWNAAAQVGYPLVVAPYGSEYWVVRSDASIRGTGRDLVIRLFPDSTTVQAVPYYKNQCGPDVQERIFDRSGRLFVSAIGYSEDGGAGTPALLWQHPEWASVVVAPKWVNLDSTNAEAPELVVPSFGDAVKAVLIVLSVSDGEVYPSHFLTQAGGVGIEYDEFLKYRLSLGLRTSPFEAQNPRAVAATPSYSELSPVFSPDGSQIAYDKDLSGTGASYHQVFVRGTTGSGETQLHPAASPRSQSRPDWSPRGDWLAYEERRADGGGPDIHVYNSQTSQERTLTPGVEGADECPAFSPTGQRVAYITHVPPPSGLSPDSVWQVRRIDLDGTNQVVLVRTDSTVALRSPRWSRDGQWIYYTANDSLRAVGASGANQGVVLNLDTLLAHARAIDLPRGGGPIAFEEVDTLSHTMDCGALLRRYVFKDAPFHRVALRDTMQRRAIPQFELPHVTQSAPRYSFDGTRIAFASDASSPGGATDIWIGQVTWNHAPTFTTAPADWAPSSCGQPLNVTYAASDPDGESVTFEGVDLPPEATLTSGGHLTWSGAGTPGAVYYSVIRALDGSGGVAQKVIQLTADAAAPAAIADLTPTIGRTSAVLNWTEVGDDSLTGTACRVRVAWSHSAITEGNFLSLADTLADPGAPGEPGSVHCAEIPTGTLTSCSSYYFGVSTQDKAGRWGPVAVDSASTLCSGGQMACILDGLMAQGGDADGWEFAAPLLESAPDTLTSDAVPLRRALAVTTGGGRARLEWHGSAGLSLDAVRLLAVDRDSGEAVCIDRGRGYRGRGVPVLSVLDSAGTELASALGSGDPGAFAPAGGAWIVRLDPGSEATALLLAAACPSPGTESDPPALRIAARVDGQWQPLAVRSPKRRADAFVVDSLPSRVLRVAFARDCIVRRLQGFEVTGVGTPVGLTLTQAQHSRLGTATAALAAAGGTEVVLRPGESVALAFEEPALAAGRVREQWLVASGRRVALAALAKAESAQEEHASRPTVAALHTGEPNPFSRTTRVRFDLPSPGRVKLDVFDSQGRRITVLADGWFPAGYHARDWDGRVAGGTRVMPGVYFCRLVAGTFRSQRRLVLLP